MSTPPGAGAPSADLRAQRRARVAALVADWTDHDVSDPGVTLLELLAFVGDTLTGYADRAAAEAYLGTGAARGPVLPGLRRAEVLDDVDPEGRHRLRVRVPGVASTEGWAEACLPPGYAAATPEVGTLVWVAAEEGDPSRLVWLGVAVGPV